MPFISPTQRQDPPARREPADSCRALLDSLGLACVAVDASFRVVYGNPAYASLAGVPADQLPGRSLLTDVPGFVGSICHRACLRALQVPLPWEVEEAIDGRCVLVRAYPTTEGVLVVIDDVTAQRRAEEKRRREEQQLYRTQKQESLELLAGTAAHNFNNLLAAILGTADLLLRDLAAGGPHRTLVELVKRSAEQAAELTRKMLVYAGKGLVSRQTLNLNALIRESHPLLDAAVGESIPVETRLAPQLSAIQADPSQVRQVILNLVLNAADAIRPTGGTVRLATGEQDVGTAAGDLVPGRYVFLEVADDGCGMSPEVLDRLFDPFFTTKASGRGLGMSVVQGMVRSHGGAIRVESKLGEGTTVRVLLPAAEETPAAGKSETTPARRQSVLVIDDEAHVRDVTARALAGIGLPVLTAGDGPDGVELLRRHRDEVGLVLLNLIMPGRGALETLTGLRRLRPDLKVILITGHDQENAQRLCGEWGLSGYLAKPYTLTSLFEKVQEALGR